MSARAYSAPVEGASHVCRFDGCAIGRAGQMLETARKIIEETGRGKMSQAMWCDQGGHAFSERDPGRQRISVSTLDENENEVQVSKDFCGDCADKSGLSAPRRTRPAAAAIPAPPPPAGDDLGGQHSAHGFIARA